MRLLLPVTFWRHCRTLVLVLWLALLAFLVQPARAEQAPSITDVRFELTDDAIRMTGNLRFELSTAVQDTLSKGVPVFFVFETSTLRERWYWSDKSVLHSKRYVRLMYLPLLRKWRVNTSNEPFEGGVSKGVLLNQHYDTLTAALGAIQRISSWKVLDRDDWNNGSSYAVEVKFRLDASQLQRTLQFGPGQSDWDLSVQRIFKLTSHELGKSAN